MILETPVRNAMLDAIDNYINTTGTGTATLKFETSGDVEVATINLQNPAFDAAASGSMALAGVPLSDTSATGGTVAQASIFARDGTTKVLEMTVATSGAEINLSDLVVNAAEQIDLTSLTLTQPAS